MPNSSNLGQILFGLSVALALLSWSVVASLYIWPKLRRLPRQDALRPLLVLHSFRFVGLSFLVTGVAASDLPQGFAVPAAVGDLISTGLALAALATLRSRVGISLVWAFNIWGSADLLYAFYAGRMTGLEAGQLAATYFIPTVIVPLLLVTHGLVFLLLTRPQTGAKSPP